MRELNLAPAQAFILEDDQKQSCRGWRTLESQTKGNLSSLLGQPLILQLGRVKSRKGQLMSSLLDSTWLDHWNQRFLRITGRIFIISLCSQHPSLDSRYRISMFQVNFTLSLMRVPSLTRQCGILRTTPSLSLSSPLKLT